MLDNNAALDTMELPDFRNVKGGFPTAFPQIPGIARRSVLRTRCRLSIFSIAAVRWRLPGKM